MQDQMTHAEAVSVIAELAEENEQMRSLLRRGLQHMKMWQQKYGKWNPEWLPPSGDVRWMEDVSEALTPNVK